MTLLLNGWRSGRSASSHERESSFHLAQDSQEKQLKDRNNRKLETLFAQVQTQKKQITLQDGKLLFSVWSFAEMATIIITIITTACRIPAKAKPGTNKKHMTSLPFVRKKKNASTKRALVSSFQFLSTSAAPSHRRGQHMGRDRRVIHNPLPCRDDFDVDDAPIRHSKALNRGKFLTLRTVHDLRVSLIQLTS